MIIELTPEEAQLIWEVFNKVTLPGAVAELVVSIKTKVKGGQK